MPIKLSCPQCSLQLTVKDELAGRRGKCPSCKADITVPSVTGAKPAPPRPAPPPPSPARPAPVQAVVLDDEDDDVVEDAEVEVEDAPLKKASRKTKDDSSTADFEVVEDEPGKSKKKSRYDEDDRTGKKKSRREEDDDDEEDDDRPSKKRRFRAKSSGPADTAGLVPLAVGAGVLVVLGLTVLFDFWYVKVTLSQEWQDMVKSMGGSARVENPDSPLLDTWRGVMILVVSILVAVGAGIAAIVPMSSRDREMSGNLVGGGSAVGAGWACAVLVWFLGITLAWMIHQLPENNKDPELMGQKIDLGIKVAVYPGIGWGLGIVAGLGVLSAMFFAAQARDRLTWLMAGAGGGLLVGLLLVLADVQPWSKTRFYGHGYESSRHHDHDFGRPRR